jgi:hypothetical protein
MRNRGSRVRVSSRAIYRVTGWICGMAVALLAHFARKPDKLMLSLRATLYHGFGPLVWRVERQNSLSGRSQPPYHAVFERVTDATSLVGDDPRFAPQIGRKPGTERAARSYCAGFASGFAAFGAGATAGFQNPGSALTQASGG